MQITTRGPQTAADWTAQNPVLDQFEIGIEVNPATGAYEKAKIGDGRTAWASLGYWNPAGSTGGGGAVLSAVLQSDFAKTNDTLANVTDLTLNLEAGKWYQVTGRFNVTADNAAGCVAAYGGTATLTSYKGLNQYTYDSTSALAVDAWSPSGSYMAVGASPGVLIFDATIEVNAGGTFIVQFGQVTTDAGNPSTLLKYSTIQATDVTP